MTSICVNLDDAVAAEVRLFAARENLSDEQFIAKVMADCVQQMRQWEAIRQRMPELTREQFREALSRVPDVEPEEYDRL